MAPTDGAAACQNLVDKTIPFLHRPPNSTRTVHYDKEEKVVSSEVWGVCLLASKVALGSQEVDFADAGLLSFLRDLAGKGLPKGGDVEMTEIHNGVIYSFAALH